MHIVLLLASFAVILAGAFLFTNAVEWLGHKLSLGVGAVGSILAAVGTAMPETLIPIVAIIGGVEGAEEVAVGAIVGAPFLLGTIAMALVGVSALLYVKRRPQGRALNAHMPTLERDLLFFMAFFALGLLLGQGAPPAVQIPAAVVCFLAYAVYARWTVMHSGDVQAEHSLDPLIMSRGIGARGSEAAGVAGAAPGAAEAQGGVAVEPEEPSFGLIALQALIGLGAMVAGAHLFVHELLWVAEELGASALVLSLVLAPLATELPEKANSFFWVREGKDSLALGNITGAMVFQSTIPIGIGLAFTDWELSSYANLSIVLGLLGGAVAYVALHRQARFSTPAIVAWALLYIVFLGVIVF